MMSTAADRREGERRHLKLNEVLSTVLLIMQLAVLIWGASALYHEVKTLNLAVAELKADIKDNREATTRVGTEVQVLKAQVEDIKKP